MKPEPITTIPFDVAAGDEPPLVYPPGVKPTPEQQDKAFGAIGASLGGHAISKVAPVAAVLAVAAAGLALPWAIAASVVGIPVAYMAGRVAGAVTGGAVGVGLSKLLTGTGHSKRLPDWIIRNSETFSLRELPARAANFFHIHALTLNDGDYERVKALVQPGDILVCSRENPLGTAFRTVLKSLCGESGVWVHTGVYAGDDPDLQRYHEGTVGDPVPGTVPEPHVLEMSAAKNRTTPLKDFIERNDRVMILRPNYKPGSADKVQQWLKDRVGMEYDYGFQLDNPDKAYCLALTHNALQAEAPEIRLEPKVVFGKTVATPDEFITSPDIKSLFSTGGQYWETFVRKFV